MCAEHGTNQSLNGKRKPILAPKISFKKNNEEVANVYLTQTGETINLLLKATMVYFEEQ